MDHAVVLVFWTLNWICSMNLIQLVCGIWSWLPMWPLLNWLCVVNFVMLLSFSIGVVNRVYYLCLVLWLFHILYVKVQTCGLGTCLINEDELRSRDFFNVVFFFSEKKLVFCTCRMNIVFRLLHASCTYGLKQLLPTLIAWIKFLACVIYDLIVWCCFSSYLFVTKWMTCLLKWKAAY